MPKAYSNLILRHGDKFITIDLPAKGKRPGECIFPGGTVDQVGDTPIPDDSLKTAALREFDEETDPENPKKQSFKQLLTSKNLTFDDVKENMKLVGAMDNRDQKNTPNPGLHSYYELDLSKVTGFENFTEEDFKGFAKNLVPQDDLARRNGKIEVRDLKTMGQLSVQDKFKGGLRETVQNICNSNGDDPKLISYGAQNNKNTENLNKAWEENSEKMLKLNRNKSFKSPPPLQSSQQNQFQNQHQHQHQSQNYYNPTIIDNGRNMQTGGHHYSDNQLGITLVDRGKEGHHFINQDGEKIKLSEEVEQSFIKAVERSKSQQQSQDMDIPFLSAPQNSTNNYKQRFQQHSSDFSMQQVQASREITPVIQEMVGPKSNTIQGGDIPMVGKGNMNGTFKIAFDNAEDAKLFKKLLDASNFKETSYYGEGEKYPMKHDGKELQHIVRFENNNDKTNIPPEALSFLKEKFNDDEKVADITEKMGFERPEPENKYTY
ncbi:MAG: NUDIX hydrolase [Legionella longbeachae]|nr:NUDIX hydrolase [Legionella longbeachae]